MLSKSDFPLPQPLRQSPAAPLVRQSPRLLNWQALGLAAILTSGAALAALPKSPAEARDSTRQWQALAIKPLSAGGDTGLRMAAGARVEPIESVPERATPFRLPAKSAPATDARELGPIRIRGQVGDGLYWSLRAAGASPAAAAQYLAALATQIDVGADVASGDSFDLVLGAGGAQLLYAGIARRSYRDLQLVRWTDGGRSQWLNAADSGKPQPVSSALAFPAAGAITSTFGYRYHPILHFARFHAGLDIGAAWGSPIVAAGEGEVVGAGWAGGYGRQVRIAHAAGLSSSYSHMSEIAVATGTYVHRGQIIGYVGSSGLSTGPHVHFEVRKNGVPIDPISARILSGPATDARLANALKLRLKELLGVGPRRV